jgi:flagellar protein FliL
MATEQRVIVGGRKPLGQAAGGGKAPEPEATEAPAKKKKGKLLVIVGAVVVLALGAAAYFFLLAPKGEGTAEPEVEEVVLGEVLQVDPVSLNLANGRYLRLGIALQLVEGAGAHTPIDTARALDQAIALFSGRDIAEVSDPVVRDELKAELVHQLEETYHHEVVDVYLTEYVTQ